MNTQILVFLIMYGILAICSIPLRKKTGYYPLLLLVLAFLGSLVAGLGLSVREVVQGTFAYFDEFLAMAAGAILIGILYVNGTFEFMIKKAIEVKNNLLKTYLLLLIVAIPSILTGLISISLVTTAKLVQRALKDSKVDNSKIISFGIVGAVIGAILPPVNAISMIITMTSYHAYYSGFSLILLIIGIPVFLIYGYLVSKDFETVNTYNFDKGNMTAIIPIIVVLILTIGHDFLFTIVPFMGYPLIFMIGAILALILSPTRVEIINKFTDMFSNFAIPLALVLSIGMFMEIVLMTGLPGMSSAYLFGLSGNMVIIISMVIILVGGYLFGGPWPIVFGALVASFASNINETVSQVSFLALSIVAIASLALSSKSRANVLSSENIDSDTISLDKNGYIALGIIIVIAVAFGLIGSAAEMLIL